MAMASESGDSAGFGARSTPARCDSLIPNVGHRGGRPSERSKQATGKFDSIPPSTIVDSSASNVPPSLRR